jgi:hypothetical protein
LTPKSDPGWLLRRFREGRRPRAAKLDFRAGHHEGVTQIVERGRHNVKQLTPACRLWDYLQRNTALQERPMKTRRLAFWWFRFVASGRFLETFFNWRARRS